MEKAKQKQEKIKLNNNKKKEFLKAQNKCYLCGKDINTYIEYLPKSRFVVERAQCHNCMTMVRVKNHSLQ